MAVPPAPAQPRRIALKVDVNTLRGTLHGVPRLVDALARHGASATFLFSLGPDHSGRAVARLLHPGVLGKARRMSVLQHYGLRTLLYGTLLPAPDIGTRAADVMRNTRDAGYEVGIHGWDRVKWQYGIDAADAARTRDQMVQAWERFVAIFGCQARVHGAAGWQMNKHGYRLTQRLGFEYCSDTRGTHPFLPVLDAELVACPQIPTTLPPVDELIGWDGITTGDVARRIVERAAELPAPQGHVFTLRAELEGMQLLPQFEELLERWRGDGVELVSLASYIEAAAAVPLPRHSVLQGQIRGRPGMVALQGAEFLARRDDALA